MTCTGCDRVFDQDANWGENALRELPEVLAKRDSASSIRKPSRSERFLAAKRRKSGSSASVPSEDPNTARKG